MVPWFRGSVVPLFRRSFVQVGRDWHVIPRLLAQDFDVMISEVKHAAMRAILLRDSRRSTNAGDKAVSRSYPIRLGGFAHQK